METNITYAALSRYPLNQREHILQDWLAQYAWEVLRGEGDDER
jgi:hypothetical protein